MPIPPPMRRLSCNASSAGRPISTPKIRPGFGDLFAPDLVYSIPEVVQGTRETICANLKMMLARSDIQLHYDNPDVHEILVVGDVAIV